MLIVILGQRVVNVVPLYMNGLVKVGQPNSVEWDTVRSYVAAKKPGPRQWQLNKWNEERMAQAIAEAQQLGENAKLRTIARAWDVPKSTLQRRLKGHVKGSQHCSGRKPVFSEEEEAELETVVKELAHRGFPLTPNGKQHKEFGSPVCCCKWN